MSNFGQCFRAFLKRKNITQFEAAEMCGFYQSRISRLCNQPHQPEQHTLKHIADRLGGTVGDLLGQGSGTRVSDDPGIYQVKLSSTPESAMLDLRRRWKKADEDQRLLMTADIRRLFAKHADAVLSWLDE